MISRMPNQKPGSDTPSSEPTVAVRSSQPPLFTAASAPSGIAISRDSSSAARVSSMVAGRRSAMTSLTGRRWKNDKPKLPCTALPRKRKKRSTSGRSSPMSRRRTSACSGVDCMSPSMISTGSPGVSVIIRKTMTVTPSSTGISCRSRSMILPTLAPAERYLMAARCRLMRLSGEGCPARDPARHAVEVLRQPQEDPAVPPR